MAAEESALTSETKAADFKDNIAFLKQERTESKRAEHVPRAREYILQKDMAGLHAENKMLEANREVVFVRGRGLHQ